MPYYSRICELLDVPPPKKDHFKIWQILMSHRNELELYRRKCDFSGKEIISAYPSDSQFQVYSNEIWWGDEWDASDHGQEIDFSKEFFPQLRELQLKVPREGTSVFFSENSKYNSHTRESKNCYLNTLAYRMEDSLFSYWVINGKNIVDSFMCNESTLCYECLDCAELYDCIGLQECYNCNNCYFSYQLRRCDNCIGCWDLVGKSYHVCNEPVSQEVFEDFKNNLINGSYKSLEEGWKVFKQAYKNAKHRATYNINCENVVGDHLINCRNFYYTFDVQNSEDFYYTISGADSKDVVLCHSAGWPSCELVYQSAVTRGSQNIAYCYYTFFSNNLRYCDSSMNLKDSFGCVGLKKKENAILNKVYTKHEYEDLKKKLISHMTETGEWGEPLPPSLSTFSYNQTAAQNYFPLTKEEAIELGYSWRDEKEKVSNKSDYELPDSLRETAGDICSKTLICQETKKAYRIVKEELEFYKKMNLPLPRLAPRTRHERRKDRRNPYMLFKAKCAKTEEEVYTSFPDGKVEGVYSEDAYRKEVY